jgi:hypothetical protein
VQGELTGARNGRMGEVRGRAGRRWTDGGLRFEEGGAARGAEVLSKKIRCEG